MEAEQEAPVRTEDRAYLERTVFGIQTDLDVLLMPENVEAMRQDIIDIVTRCTRALERRNAA